LEVGLKGVNMKKIILVLAMLFVYKTYSAPKKEVKSEAKSEKTYTQKEFDDAVHKEVMRQISFIKKKSVVDLTKELVDERKKLKDKNDELDKKEEQLNVAQEELAKKILETNEHQKRILGCIDANNKNAAKRVGQVVQIMSNMKPDKAAEILSVQDTEIAVRILSKLEPLKASKIFNKMDKEVSARLQKEYMSMKQ
jgi:flagellar motility protein MotE (MotC chaperone)